MFSESQQMEDDMSHPSHQLFHTSHQIYVLAPRDPSCSALLYYQQAMLPIMWHIAFEMVFHDALHD
jgi:hypothetical protein